MEFQGRVLVAVSKKKQGSNVANKGVYWQSDQVRILAESPLSSASITTGFVAAAAAPVEFKW